MLSSITTFKKILLSYFKHVFIEKFFNDDKNIYSIYFLCQIEILLLNLLKLFKITDFIPKFLKFKVFWQP